jgi:FKBP-type peptidyl-prolyl cis-trans isomerase (trigger factor)
MENESAPVKRNSRMKTIIIAVVVILLLGIGGYVAHSKGLLSTGVQHGKTVATVNGAPIYQRDVDIRFNQLKDTYTQQGANITDPNIVATIKKQIVDEIVNEQLVLQDAQKQNITVTPAEVKSSLDQLAATAGSQDKLNAQITQFGMTQADLQETVKRNLILQKYIDQYTAKQNITVSEAEIAQTYAAAIKGQPATTTPALKDVHDKVEQTVRNQKVAQLILALVNQLKQNAKVQLLN